MVHLACLTAEPSAPSSMSKVKQFLHKVSIEKMKANHAVIPETNKVGHLFLSLSHCMHV